MKNKNINKAAKKQALKDFKSENLHYSSLYDELMQESGMINPGFKRNSYKKI
jgi:hypothetical protein